METTRTAGRLDPRFSDATAQATGWQEVEDLLATAELYWLTTVRADGRPHVTPLVGVWTDGAAHFCTGLGEQKARNLEHHAHVAVTTGCNAWARGTDVVIEGEAVRILDRPTLQLVADEYLAKYGEDWRFDVAEDGFADRDTVAAVFRVEPAKVVAFAKEPHGQTTFRPWS